MVQIQQASIHPSYCVFCSETILHLLKDTTILLLSPCMAYSGKLNWKWVIVVNVSVWQKPTATMWTLCSAGLELSFYSGVYGTCIGATTQFGDSAKGLIGISGIVVGVGEIVGEFTIPLWEICRWCLVTELWVSIRRRIVWIAVQEQSLQTDLCGVSGNGCPFCCFLSDLPQHPRWRPCGLW